MASRNVGKMGIGLALGAGLVATGLREGGWLRQQPFFTEQAKKWGVPIPAVVALLAYGYLRFGKPKVSSYVYWACWGAVTVGVYWAVRARGQASPESLSGVGAWWTPLLAKGAAWAGKKAAPWLAKKALPYVQRAAQGKALPAQSNAEWVRAIVRQELARRAVARRQIIDAQAA